LYFPACESFAFVGGNKSQVTAKAFKFPEQHNLPFFFVSAADGTNVVKVFEQAVEEAVRHRSKVRTHSSSRRRREISE
jgi:hypothetical protein